jgi:hypothetical protein
MSNRLACVVSGGTHHSCYHPRSQHEPMEAYLPVRSPSTIWVHPIRYSISMRTRRLFLVTQLEQRGDSEAILDTLAKTIGTRFPIDSGMLSQGETHHNCFGPRSQHERMESYEHLQLPVRSPPQSVSISACLCRLTRFVSSLPGQAHEPG